MSGRPGSAVAAVDCGTNSTRLLVVDGEGQPAARLMRITRLGQGVDSNRSLGDQAIERTVAVLEEYRSVMDALDVAQARMVATSAVRDASNGQVFLDAASKAIGVTAELLSGREEGQLAYIGATAGLPPGLGDDVVLDIGGGSTELIVRDRGEVRVVSLALGCVRLTERHLAHDPPLPEELLAANSTISAEMNQAVRAVPELDRLRPESRLIGLAGTVSTLAMLDQGLTEYEWDRVHHSVLGARAVKHWVDVLAREPAAARVRRPGMVPGREDVIVGGAAVLRAVMERFGFLECLVSEADILDGLVASLRNVNCPRMAART